MSIRIFTTGGTIDGYTQADMAYGSQKSLIPQFLDQGRLQVDVTLTSLFEKDSRAIDHEDRQNMIDAVQNTNEDKIIITHGTDTMIESAKMLMDAGHGKVVIFTGAMIPGPQDNTDSLFNIGTAIMAVQQTKPGTYIAMHGRLYDPRLTVKNTNSLYFEELDETS